MSGQEQPLVLKLENDLDARAVASLHVDLLQNRGKALQVDAGDVARIGGGGLQVLLSAVKCWADDGHAFGIINPSEAFSQTASLAGLADQFCSSTGALQ